MRVIFTVCAQSATVDRTTNRLSVFNVIDHLPISALPLTIPAISFVAVIEGDDQAVGSVNGMAEVASGAQTLFRYTVPVVFTDNRIARVILNFQSIPVHSLGPLTFRLVLPDGTTASTSFQVTSIATPVAPVTTQS